MGRFEWQEGFGAFSCSHYQLNDVIAYINNQEEHHSTKTFRIEYIELLQKLDIDFNDKYLFKEIE